MKITLVVLAAVLALGAGGAAKPRLNGVFDVAVAQDGSLLIADRSERIYRFRSGKLTPVVRIGFPVEVAPDPRGGFAVVSNETAIRRVDRRGRLSTLARNLRRITALAFDPAGNIYFSELPDRVRRFDRATRRITTVAEGGLNWPHGLVVAGDQLYVADTFNNRVVTIELANGAVRTAAAGLNQPVDVERGPDGTIYVADYGNGRLARIAEGEAVTVARLIGPNSVWVRGGSAYVSERIFPRVRRVDLASGRVTTVVGGM
jgi:serine/threonine-protein kinase